MSNGISGDTMSIHVYIPEWKCFAALTALSVMVKLVTLWLAMWVNLTTVGHCVGLCYARVSCGDMMSRTFLTQL